MQFGLILLQLGLLREARYFDTSIDKMSYALKGVPLN